MSAAWLNEAGGLRYHWRGFRYAETLWAPFRFALAEWLYAWEPPERRLVVVGASGGWCVQPFFFERFTDVLCLEPDPVAHFLFRRRLARAPLETRPRLRFESRDHLLSDPTALVRLLDAEGDVAVLFTNILGQVRVLLGADSSDDARLAALRAAVGDATKSRSWASFHDRVSGSLEPQLEQPARTPSRLSDAEIVRRFFPALEAGASAADGSGELLDHLTAGFFPADRPHAYFAWPLMPGVFHLIEATCGVRAG
ncbi:MAG TPA: hypothetical protein VMI54_22070 [Polyangiaceae bacterium]|nr:hypothetical protein [Polyangiaceae bacterium]